MERQTNGCRKSDCELDHAELQTESNHHSNFLRLHTSLGSQIHEARITDTSVMLGYIAFSRLNVDAILESSKIGVRIPSGGRMGFDFKLLQLDEARSTPLGTEMEESDSISSQQ